jgi:hypothetical protein
MGCLEGGTRRAFDISEGDKIDAKALKALIRAAAALNVSKQAPARPVRSAKQETDKLISG